MRNKVTQSGFVQRRIPFSAPSNLFPFRQHRETALFFFKAIHKKMNGWTDIHFPILLRLMKFVSGLSPAEPLVRDTVLKLSELVPYLTFPFHPLFTLLALWETIIGLGLLVGRWKKTMLIMLAFQILGAASPLILLPHEVWSAFPLGLTIEGQYIVKNIVIMSSAIAYASTMQGQLNQSIPVSGQDAHRS